MKLRPEFLTSPHDWTRSRRTGQTRTDYACAVQHNVRRSSWHPAEVIVVIGFVLFLLVAFA